MIIYQENNSSVPYNLQINVYDDFYFFHHLHRDYELIYVLEGAVTVTVEDRVFLMEKGQYALILQNQIHGFSTEKSSKVWVCVFAAEYVREFHKLIGSKVCDNNIFVPDDTEELFLKKKLIEGVPDRLELCSALTLVTAVFMKQIEIKDIGDLYDKNILHRMLSYVSDHYTENITLSGMAEALGYEEHYLSRCFHSKFGKNFRHFVNEYRVSFAKHLLISEKKMSMTEIAYASGFQTARSFNRAFLEIEGITPKSYR